MIAYLSNKRAIWCISLLVAAAQMRKLASSPSGLGSSLMHVSGLVARVLMLPPAAARPSSVASQVRELLCTEPTRSIVGVWDCLSSAILTATWSEGAAAVTVLAAVLSLAPGTISDGFPDGVP